MDVGKECILRTAKPCAPRTRKPKLYGDTPWAVFFPLAWLLLVLAFTKSPSLVSRVLNKPNTQPTSDANDFVKAKSHACKRETCSHASTKIRTVEKTQGKWLLLIFTRFWADIPYKRDKKFNTNTLKLNSLSPKVLNSHIFPLRNVNSTKSNISSLTL